MNSLGTVLIAAGSGNEWSAIAGVLAEEHGYRVFSTRSDTAARTLAEVELVIAEEEGDGRGLDLLARLRISNPDIVRVLALEPGARLPAARLASCAVYQFVRKPLDAGQVELVVKRGLEARELSRRHRLLSREFKVAGDFPIYRDHHDPGCKAESQRFEKLAFVSDKMASLCALARKAAPTDLPILIQGETGTGKELLARAIHYNSDRRASPLMVQNCGGLYDELLQSELFGHKRGRSPAPSPTGWACSGRPTGAPSSSTRSPRCRRPSRCRSCASCRRARSSRSAPTGPPSPTCASSPPPTGR